MIVNSYIESHTTSYNGLIITTDSIKSAIIISLLNRVTMFENSVYAQGRKLIEFEDT